MRIIKSQNWQDFTILSPEKEISPIIIILAITGSAILWAWIGNLMLKI